MAYKIIKSAINRYAAGSVYPKASGEYIHENDKNEMFSSSNVKKKSDYFIKTSNEDKNIKPEEKSETTVNNKNYDSKMLNYWLESIQKYSLKNAATGQEFITPEIKALFSSEKTSINMNELIDENGNVKQGYELFDLNHDNKLDDFEISYFTSGGSMLKTDNKILDVENFIITSIN